LLSAKNHPNVLDILALSFREAIAASSTLRKKNIYIFGHPKFQASPGKKTSEQNLSGKEATNPTPLGNS